MFKIQVRELWGEVWWTKKKHGLHKLKLGTLFLGCLFEFLFFLSPSSSTGRTAINPGTNFKLARDERGGRQMLRCSRGGGGFFVNSSGRRANGKERPTFITSPFHGMEYFRCLRMPNFPNAALYTVSVCAREESRATDN